MPYSFSPPALGSISNTVTSCPCSASAWAQDNPAGPAPTTATFRPVGSARVKGWISRSNSQSVA